MYDLFQHQANFLTVYIKEAHASDEWPMGGQVCYKQPKTLEQRIKIARDFIQRFDYKWPMLIDSIDNKFEQAYFAWPERFYILLNGKFVYYGEMGPYGYKPDEIKAWLTEYCSKLASN